MARLYVFAIGGTGSRVLKSLTMLLASGIKPVTRNNKQYEIVPIIIDPHRANEDLKRTERIISNYNAIAESIEIRDSFFATPIKTLDNIVDSKNKLSGSFTFNLQEVGGKRFGEYIDFNQLDDQNRALTELLFSGTSKNKRQDEISLLDVEMDIGFVGNPNIGSVVLNQFKDSIEFKQFANNFAEDDRIFIISSIFGGTGAAGFPTILKNIRAAMSNPNIDGKGFLQDSKIGAVTVLPYFNIEKDKDSAIQKSDFVAKTRAALYYYKNNVTGNNSINALYYIADNHTGKPYKNDPGYNGQKNDAHFIELVSALSIIDFLEIDDSDLKTDNGKAARPIYKEFGMKNNVDVIKFSDFEIGTERKISLGLSQLALFEKYVDSKLFNAVDKEAWSLDDNPKINRSFLDDPIFRTNLSEFLSSFKEWLIELKRNQRSFVPFNLGSSIDIFIVDRSVEKGLFKKSVDYALFDSELTRSSRRKTFASPLQKLVKIFFQTTDKLLQEKFGLKN